MKTKYNILNSGIIINLLMITPYSEVTPKFEILPPSKEKLI